MSVPTSATRDSAPADREQTTLDPSVADRLKRDDHGLVAAIVQQHDTGEVLMLGWMNDEALRRTVTTGRVTFWSRSRSEYWRKGDTSGHAQYVRSVALDCDGDALLIQVDQVGAACHTGTRTCFEAGGPLDAVVGRRPDAVAGSSSDRAGAGRMDQVPNDLSDRSSTSTIDLVGTADQIGTTDHLPDDAPAESPGDGTDPSAGTADLAIRDAFTGAMTATGGAR